MPVNHQIDPFRAALQAATLANMACTKLTTALCQYDPEELARCAWDMAAPMLRAAVLAMDVGGIHADEEARRDLRRAIASYIDPLPPMEGGSPWPTT